MDFKKIIIGCILGILISTGIFLSINYLLDYSLNKLSKFPQIQFAPLENTPIEERIKIEKKFSEFLKNSQNIFRIKTGLGDYGTCFLIEESILATASHLIEEMYENLIFTNQWELADLVGISYTKDIAFLKLRNINYGTTNPFKFKSTQSIFNEFENQKIVPIEKLLIGMKCMNEEKPRILIGKISSWDSFTKKLVYTIMNDSRGCSGAPIFTYDGYIIGIHQLQGGIIGEGTDISEVLNALKTIKKLP